MENIGIENKRKKTKKNTQMLSRVKIKIWPVFLTKTDTGKNKNYIGVGIYKF